MKEWVMWVLAWRWSLSYLCQLSGGLASGQAHLDHKRCYRQSVSFMLRWHIDVTKVQCIHTCTYWLHTHAHAHTPPILLLHWQTDVCRCLREWESEQYSVIESLLPLCAFLPLPHCGNNLLHTVNLSWRVFASCMSLIFCLTHLFTCSSLPVSFPTHSSPFP